MDTTIFIDSVRFAHILAVCAGLGTSILADKCAARAMSERIDDTMLHALHQYHRVVVVALVGMWLTGVAMIGIRTGFDFALMTPKLLAKVLTVSFLTVNACAIAWVAMPIMQRSRGKSIAELPARTRTVMGMIGGVSTASWLLALAMGVSKVLAASSAQVFVYLLPAVYLCAVLGALTVLLGSGPRFARQSR
jgi:hypothetical protein